MSTICADGNTVVIGSQSGDNFNPSAGNIGYTKIFKWSVSSEPSSKWIQSGETIYGENAGDISFEGTAVSMDSAGKRVVIGAHNNSGTGNYGGHARVYELLE